MAKTDSARYQLLKVALTQKKACVHLLLEIRIGWRDMVATKVTRKYIDCREFPDASGCTMVLQADDVNELVSAAMHHSVHKHGAKDTPAFRRLLEQSVRDGHPPEKTPAPQYMTAMAMRAATEGAE